MIYGMNEYVAPQADQSHAKRHRPNGPHPGIVGTVCLVLFATSLVLMIALSHGSFISSPFADDSPDFFARHGLASRLTALFQLGASVPLGIYAATMYARLQRLGVRVPGPSIAFFGGTSASVLLAISALLTWTAGNDAVAAHPELTRALGFLAFGTGGFAHLLGLGLLVAGIAVPGLILRLLPLPLAWAGLVIAAICELSILTMALEPFQALVPIGRFTALAWIVAAGFLLPRSRQRKNTLKGRS
ncbi:hypothetical protein [Brevibacterium atlanticum]|uniref:hypothetical protein n=1 Tax=Brevibacterium atlanticum TaxID=2697563 RepID=UPI001AA19528|nr:hypothetical protein [Brevibacterium atlanticum]